MTDPAILLLYNNDHYLGLVQPLSGGMDMRTDLVDVANQEVTQVRLLTMGLLELSGTPVQPGRFTKGFALLAYLAVKSTSASRDELADLLWGSADQRRARSSLSQTIYTLRQYLPGEALQVAGDRIALDRGVIPSDYQRFNDAVRRGDELLASAVYGGEFLGGIPYITDEFDDWRIRIAAAAESDALIVNRSLLSGALDSGVPDQIALYSDRILRIHPHDVPAIRARLEAMGAAGNTAGAVRELAAARTKLLRELGEVPTELDDTFEKGLLARNERNTEGPVARPLLPIVGRSAELSQMRSAWERAKSSRVAILVTGEAGIGKSRIASQIVRRAAIEGARTVAHSCAEMEASIPYATVAGLLRDAGQSLAASQLPVECRTALASIVPDLLPGIAQPAQFTKLLIAESTAQFLVAYSKNSPVIIFVDDFQWIDDNSRELLGYLYRRLASSSALFVLSGRGLVDVAAVAGDFREAEVIDLAVLSDDMCDELIDAFSVANHKTVDTPARTALKGKIGGRPLLMLEALYELGRSTDLITLQSTPAALASPSIEALVARRFASLSVDATSLMSAAAVVNRQLHLFHVGKIAGLELERAAEAADELVRNNILTNSSTVRFTHDLLREVAFGQLSRPQRVGWHFRVAKALETSTTRYSEIAHHYERAGDVDAAYRFSRLAAAEAARFASFGDVDSAFEQMLRCAPKEEAEGVQADWFKHLVQRGRKREAYALIPQVRPTFEGKADLEGELLCVVVSYSMDTSAGRDSSVSIGGNQEILDLTRRYGPGDIARALWRVADSIRSSGDHELLHRMLDEIVGHATTVDRDSAVASELLSVAAVVGMITVGYEYAGPLAEAALAAAASASDSQLVRRAEYSRATVLLSSGDVLNALAAYDDIVRSSGTADDDVLEKVKSNSVIALTEQARYDEAMAMAGQVLRYAAPPRRPYAYGNMALVALRQGDADQARRHCDSWLASSASTGFDWVVPHVNAILGLSALIEGDDDRAALHARKAEASMNASAGIVDNSPIYELIARVAYMEGNPTRAQAVLREGVTSIAHKDWIAGARLRVLLFELGLDSDVAGIVQIQEHARAFGARALEDYASHVLKRLPA